MIKGRLPDRIWAYKREVIGEPNDWSAHWSPEELPKEAAHIYHAEEYIRVGTFVEMVKKEIADPDQNVLTSRPESLRQVLNLLTSA